MRSLFMVLQSALKKMRKLRGELKVICSAEHDPVREDAEHPFCSLLEHRLLENSCLSSGTNSIAGGSSANNLHALGYLSDHGSDDNAHPPGNSNNSSFHSRDARSYSNTPPLVLHSTQHPGGGLPRRLSASPPHVHTPSANIPIIPPVHRMTPSQSAAVAVSGVAAFSFVTTATTGSDQGEDATGGAAEPHEERLSIGSNSSFGGDLDFQEAASECVDGLKVR